MKANRQAKDGVALIVVLGLLSILTILAVAFAISMRVERMAARNYADLVRAKHMVQTALIRAIDDVDDNLIGSCYPEWDVLLSESTSVGGTCDILAGSEGADAVPRSLYNQAGANDPDWVDIDMGLGAMGAPVAGRVAWLALNCSGLIDINEVGGENRDESISVRELDLSGMPDLDGAETLLASRDAHYRYETLSEIGDVIGDLRGDDSKIKVIPEDLCIYSYDPDKDELIKDPQELGMRDAELIAKFNINSITNYAGYTSNEPDAFTRDSAFMSEYYDELVRFLEADGFTGNSLMRPEDVAWNIINYLDANRVPQSREQYPYRHTEGGECVPMINEIVLRDDGEGKYHFDVELWYPFVGVDDEGQPVPIFKLEIGVFSEQVTGQPEETIMDRADLSHQTFVIPNMAYGATEFFVPDSDLVTKFSFPDGGNIGEGANRAYFLARVLLAERGGSRVVDESMGYSRSGGSRPLMEFSEAVGYSINDPRSNGQPKYWTTADGKGGNGPYASSANTLGEMNTNCKPWVRKGQGLPIFFRNAAMVSIGELGHIFASNLDDEVPDPEDHYWQSINLLNYEEGSFLLDRLTVREKCPPQRGLVALSSAQREPLKALFHNMKIGPPGDEVTLREEDIGALVDVLVDNGPYVSFADLFRPDGNGLPPWDGGQVGRAFRQCAQGAAGAGTQISDILREDTFRKIVDMVTFRQNIFTIYAAGQIVIPPATRTGDTVVLAEKRGYAVVYRDSYTGRNFIRSFRWVSD